MAFSLGSFTPLGLTTVARHARGRQGWRGRLNGEAMMATGQDLGIPWEVLLVGGFNLPLWKMMEFVNGFRMTFLFYEMENKIHVPNHQAVYDNFTNNLEYDSIIDDYDNSW